MKTQPYYITVSRQFGRMGRPIAKRMSELLEINYYDRDILEAACKEMGRPVSELPEYDEKSYSRMKYPLGIGEHKMRDHLFNLQQCFISELLLKEQSCIIVGRCSDYILRHEKRTMNVFIYAPYEERLKNCVEELGLSKEEAEKMIKSVDKARDNYHYYYTGERENTFANRHIMINSSIFGIEGTAQMLVDIAKKKFMGKE